MKNKIARGEVLSPEEELFYDHLRELYDPFYKMDLERLKSLINKKKNNNGKLTEEENKLLE